MSKFKDEVDQPSIREFVSLNTTKSNDQMRSTPTKRKPSTENGGSVKRKITSPDISRMATTPDQIQTEHTQVDPLQKIVEITGVDSNLLKAVEMLLQPLRQDIQTLVRVQTETQILREENTALTIRIKQVELKNDSLTNRICELENKILESNVILHGIRETPWEADDARQEKIYDVLQETVLGRTYDERIEIAKTMYIKSTKRLGPYSSLRSRPISVEFMYKADAEYLLKNMKHLPEGVFVNKEYCKETEECRKLLRPYLKAARRLPRYYKKCKLEGDKLVLRGVTYTVNTLHRLPEDLQGFNISSITDENIVGFFGSLNPLSNFHPARFKWDGVEYFCSEQMIQHKKAKFFGEKDVADRILQCTTATECKRLSREISSYRKETWEENAKTICQDGILKKFEQNEELCKALLNTGDKTIVEATYDTFWGTGVPLDDRNCLNQRYWSNQGILGEMLEAARRSIRNSQQVPTATSQSTTSTNEETRRHEEITPATNQDTMETS